jgi:multiple sugar transport system substrate-binding protein
MLKRAVVICLIIATLCLSGATTLAVTKITVAMSQRYFDAVKDVWKQQHPDIELEPYILTGSWAQQMEKAMVMVAGGSSLDVLYTATEGFEIAVKSGLLLPLNDYVANDVEFKRLLDDIHPGLLASFTLNGNFYMTPITWNTQVMMLNMDRLGEVGLNRPDDAWTMDDYRSMAKKATVDTSGDGTPDLWGTYIANYYFGNMAWFFAAGNTFLTTDLKTPLMDQLSAIEVLEFIHDTLWVDRITSMSGSETTFINGNYAIYPTYPGVIRSMISNPKFEFDLMMMPKWKVKETALGSAGVGVVPSSTNRAAAYEFVKFMASYEAQAALMDIAGLPNVPSRRASLRSPWGFKIYDTLNYARLVPAPSQFALIDQALLDWVGKVRNRTVAAQEAAMQLQKQLLSILQ